MSKVRKYFYYIEEVFVNEARSDQYFVLCNRNQRIIYGTSLFIRNSLLHTQPLVNIRFHSKVVL